jgi:RNA polymerase sigma factor (sigma-70 family)
LATPDSNLDDLTELTRTESDSSLLRLIADGKQPWADVAFQVFFDRHKSYMWVVCSRVAANLKGDSWAQDLVNDTFARAYQKAGTFALPPDTKSEDESTVIRAWLGKIATRLLQQRLKRFGSDSTKTDEEWAAIESGIPSVSEALAPQVPSEELMLIEAALDTLPDREAHVLRITFQYHRPDKRFQRLPNSVVQELAATLGTSPEYLRKIRERALKKVFQYVEAHK